MKIENTFTKECKNGAIKTFLRVYAFDKLFIVEVPKNGKAAIIKDIEIVENILNKPEISATDRFTLLRIYNVAFHESGKIEDIYSFDSSATNCEFCAKMRKLAEKDNSVICNYCYDFSQEQYRFAALNRHTLNMVIMQSVEFEIAELATLPAGYVNRVNSSGDCANQTYANNMVKLAIAFPYSRIAVWTKAPGFYIAACRKYGKPESLVLIKSSVHIDKPDVLPEYFDYVFTVYFDKAKVEQAIASGACECNGKKCNECGKKCYFATWEKGSNICELLRK